MTTMNSDKTYFCWVMITQSQDVPGEWVAHNLAFDVVSQGTSIQHALEMVGEASYMVVEDDLEHGRDPQSRQAPDECFDEMFKLTSEGQQIQLRDVLTAEGQKTVRALAVQMAMRVQQLRQGVVSGEGFDVPMAVLPKASGAPELRC